MARKADFERKSKETEIKASVNVDGKGGSNIKTNIGILDHMLELFTFHGFFDIDLQVEKADLEIDIHHTNEDIAIVLGKTFKKALDDMKGVKRFGCGAAPMESTLGQTVIDLSGRGFCSFRVDGKRPDKGEDGYTFVYLEHFFESFANNIGATINIWISNPEDSTADIHTVVETVFKSFGLALDQATQIDPRRKGMVPSTKGIID